MRFLLLIAGLILFTISCKTTKKAGEPEQEAVSTELLNENLSPDDLVFTLKKGGCYGTCPVYTLRIYNNKYAEFTGKKDTDKLGIHGKMISSATYKAVKKQFDESNFFEFQDVYESNIPDLPSATLAYQKDGKKKKVIGKRERPEALHKIQFTMEKIAEAKEGWQLVKSVEEMIADRPKIDKSKIVVKIAKGSEMARWFSKMRQEHGMQLLESLSANNDTWLIKFNPKEYEPEKFLELLRMDPVVGSAEFYQGKRGK